MKIEPLNINNNIKQSAQVEERLRRILKEWEGTPHMDGQQAKGVGVDCVRFAAAVLDELGGTTTSIEHLPRDLAFHQREKAVAGMRLFIDNFNGQKVEEPYQPGDVFVTGPVTGGPGHAIILGPDGGLWQSASKKVIRSGLEALSLPLYKHKATFRVRDRERWFR